MPEESQADERLLYIANVQGTSMWMVLLSDQPPKAGDYREYRVPERHFDAALVAADMLAASYQGKLPEDVELPETLIEWSEN